MKAAPGSMDASSADSTSASVSAPDSMKMTTEDGVKQEMELVPDSMEMMTEDGVENEKKTRQPTCLNEINARADC